MGIGRVLWWIGWPYWDGRLKLCFIWFLICLVGMYKEAGDMSSECGGGGDFEVGVEVGIT